MTIEVKHREDSLLQNSVTEEMDPRFEGTAVEKTKKEYHPMILKFLDELIIGKEFENEAALEAVLATWPQFAKDNGLEVSRDWRSIDIYGETIGFEGSLGGTFTIGFIELLENL